MKLSFRFLLFAVLFSFLFSSCNRSDSPPENDPGFAEFIAAHTAGVISAYSNIELELQNEVNPGVEPGTIIDAELFDISPNVDGVLTWGSSSRLVFTPSEPMVSGQVYNVEFSLGSLMEVDSKFDTYEFTFQVIDQQFSLLTYSLTSYDNKDLVWNSIQGEITSGDKAQIEELVSDLEWVGADGLSVDWSVTESTHRYSFTIDSVQRKEQRYSFDVRYKDEVMGTFSIPGLSEFDIINIHVEQVPKQVVIISFSDPISTSQQTLGLFRLGAKDVESVEISGSTVKLYPENTLYGDVQLEIAEGLKNAQGFSFPKTYRRTVSFTSLKPEVRFVDEGNIIPMEGVVHIPFQAVSLRAVDVKIYKIFANNVHQFLQNNNLSGARELRRVARPIHQQRIELTGENVNYNAWTTFSIDLDQMIRRDPGAIYRVELGFKRSYSMYMCEGEEDEDRTLMEAEDWDSPISYDDYYYDDYYYDYYYHEGYDYSERDNPCHVSYYTSRILKQKNILASDIGLVVKGNQSDYFAYVTSLTTANGIAGAEVKMFNYQGQLLSKKSTDGKGFVKFDLDGTPYLAQVEHNNQFAYVRLDRGSSLSLSSFDVGGSDASSGLHAYLYGERGVWRPGDTIFLDAILNDNANPLPENHPLVLTVRDAEGKEVFRQIKQRGDKSIHNFVFQTDREAGTGTYQATLEVGGKRFYKSLPVETIQPNRLDIEVKALAGVIQPNTHPDLSIHAEWLTGAKAPMAKVNMEGRIESNSGYFENYSDYDFRDDTRSIPALGGKTLFDGTLDSQGDMRVAPQLGYLRNSPGMLQLVVGTKVFEPSGRFSINSTRIPLAPFTHFVGLKLPKTNDYGYLETDNAHRIQLVRVDAEGKPASGSAKVSIYKVSWSWWWSTRRGNATYLNRESSTLIKQGTVRFSGGKAHFDFAIPDNHWGRIFVLVEDEESGHRTSSLAYVDWAYGRDRTGRSGGESASVLNVKTDKEKYKVGDVAKISVPSSEGGRLLLSIEDGTTQLLDKVLTSSEGQTVYNLPITEDMAPNVYVNAMLIQPHGNTANDLPLRLYGIAPIMVEDPLTHLEPIIEAPESIRPESEYTIQVSEKNGARMEYTLAVVDEGLLGLTNFTTPNPWSYFYAKRALGIRTWDMFDLVIGAYSGRIARMLAVGGDAALLPENEENADRFVPVVRHLGPFVLEAGSRKTHTLHMPNYIGNVRVMVVAANRSEAYGSAQKNIRVKQPLMAQLTMPRVLGPGEKIMIPVTVFSMDESISSVNVKLSTTGHLSVAETQKTIRFSEEGQQTVYFEGTVADALGLASVRVDVSSGREKSFDKIEIGVRSPVLPQTREQIFSVQESAIEHVAEPFGLIGSNDLIVEVSNLPKLNLSERLNYLIGYPNGCLEQTTSKSFAQLNLDNWVAMSADQKAQVQSNIREGLNKLRRFQLTGGGFRYWPNQSSYSAYASTYAGHFILSAEKSGYTLPTGLKEGYLRFERQMARSWTPGSYYRYNNDLNQAYRLYTLALAGEPEIGAMNRLRNSRSLSEAAGRRLAAAFAIMGETQVAKELLTREWIKPERSYYYYSYGSQTRDLALYVETMYDLGNTGEAYRLGRELAEQISSGYQSTHSLGYSLHVLSKLFKTGSEDLKATVTINGKVTEINTNSVVQRISVEDFEQNASVKVENHGTAPIYARIFRVGVPRYGNETASESRVSMNVSYLDSEGRLLDVSKVKVGTPITVKVELDRPVVSQDYDNMALTQIFPSGWEISNSRIMATSETGGSNLDYQDIRDDRVLSYFSMHRIPKMVIYVDITASYPGKWYLPPTQVESMYEGTVNASNVGRWVEVVAQ